MAVPAHDSRDLEFAQKFKLPIELVDPPMDGGERPRALLAQKRGVEELAVAMDDVEAFEPLAERLHLHGFQHLGDRRRNPSV